MVQIAVVDDDEQMRSLMVELLRSEGWGVLTHDGAEPILPWLKTARPDVLIIDLRLKGAEDGWDIVQQVRLHPYLHRLAIIVCSGDTRALQEHQTWLEQHDIAKLPKPFEIDDLYIKVEQALSQEGRQQA